MGDSLLTKEEIEAINTEAKNSKIKNENLIELGFEKTSILRISQKTGLILFQGNLETGFEHIIYRHSPTSRPEDWQIKNNQLRFNEPSKFSFWNTPIFDYLLIADHVYLYNEKESSDDNNPSDKFDIFNAKYEENCGKSRMFKLLLYKGTMIIHTLYPVKAYTNKKKNVNLRKGYASVEERNGSHIESSRHYEIPYYDSNATCRAKLKISVYLATKREDYIIEINNSTGRVVKREVHISRTATPHEHAMDRITYLDFFEDLSSIERIIDKMVNEIDKNPPDNP